MSALVQVHQTIMRDGIPSDWLYIDSLRKKEGNALGFNDTQVFIA